MNSPENDLSGDLLRRIGEVTSPQGLPMDAKERALEATLAEHAGTSRLYRGRETERGYTFPSLSVRADEEQKRVIRNSVEHLAEHGVSIDPLDLVRIALEKHGNTAVEAMVQELLEEDN